MHISARNIKNESDEKLLHRFIKYGSLDVLGELYNRHIHLVYGVCLKYFENRDDAKDAVNKIFELLITEIPKFEIQNFKSWLFVVTKNFCLMEIRKQKSVQKKWEKYSNEIRMESEEFSHPIDEASRETLEKGLKDCIEGLKKEQQQCISMFYFEELCYKEIAERLKLEQNKVKSFIQNGRRNLKICLEEKKVAYEV